VPVGAVPLMASVEVVGEPVAVVARLLKWY
jgi:hypothetical protein